MNFNAITLESSLFLIEYCYNNRLSRDQILISKWASNYEFDNKEILNFCMETEWLVENEGMINCTKTSLNILDLETKPLQWRFMLNYLLEEKDVYWKSILTKGREVSKTFLNKNDVQILEWCGLFEDSDDVSDWWLNHRIYNDDEEDEKRILIGRLGERKTLAFERERIGKKPKWVALELGDQEGYDVLSWKDTSSSSERLRIEVKASVQEIGKADFYLTRNEWERAISGGNHIFHLWPEVGSGRNKPLVLTVEELLSHIPKDPGDGKWLEVKIPMITFQE